MSKIMISELQETTSAPDSSYIAIDNGTTTNKITIANYNENANATAKRYAEASQGYSNEALTAKDGAVSAKNEAETLANTASSYANAARASADAAAGSASEASGYVGSAQASATNALASARAAEASAAGIDNQVKLAKSWAVGNTGVRADEAVNNAMYWAGQAAAAAGGGVVSFNGRTGSVLPNAGDYSSDQIAHVNSDSTYSNVETEINNLQTSRLKTYASDSTQWDTTPTANSTKPVTSGGVKAQFDSIGTQIADINEEIADLHAEDSRLSSQISKIANYSTSESDTGMKWIDNKPIYRKVVDFGALPNSGTKTVAHGIANLDAVINIYGYIRSANAGITTYLPISVPSPFGVQYSILTSVNNTNVSISTGVDRTTNSAVVVLEYTKK